MLDLTEFLTVALVHLLAVASPGPDFAIVLKQSIRLGRYNAIATSLGIGTGILVHVAYSIVGIGLIIASTPALLTGLKLVAAGYFLYIAWHGLRASKPTTTAGSVATEQLSQESASKSFVTGFLINALNVKATLFFVALYSLVIAPETSTEIRLAYGVYMALATAFWFSIVSYLLGTPYIRNALVSKGYWVDRLMGLVLLLLALQILWEEFVQFLS